MYYSRLCEVPDHILNGLHVVVAVDSPQWSCHMFAREVKLEDGVLQVTGPVVTVGEPENEEERFGYRVYSWYRISSRNAFWTMKPFDREQELDYEARVMARLDAEKTRTAIP